MAAKAARPATAIELPRVLAAPLKGVMGEEVEIGAVELRGVVSLRVFKVGSLEVDLRSG